MRSKLAIVVLTLAGGCFKSTGPELCAPVVTSWASPTYQCLAAVKETPPPPAPAPPPEAPPPAPAPKTEVTQEQIKLKEKVEFQTDSAVLADSSKGLLDEVVQVMKDHPEIEHVRVAGHTDSEGKRKHNQKLSDERAASVKQYLVDHGVAADRLSSKGYGQDRPIADNKTEAGRAENRRVEIHILRRKGDAKDRDPDQK
jgi:outer membrane protein OmpA-like peptidoglycan-associated protein